MAFFASKFVYKERMNTCAGCEHFQKMALMCKSCGCFMPAKAKIANIRCPEDKWMEVYGTEEKEPETITLVKNNGPESEHDKRTRLINTATNLRKEADKLELEARGLKKYGDF